MVCDCRRAINECCAGFFFCNLLEVEGGMWFTGCLVNRALQDKFGVDEYVIGGEELWDNCVINATLLTKVEHI